MIKAKIPPCPIGEKQVQKILSCFNFTRNQMVLRACFKEELLNYHKGELILTKRTLFQYIVELGNQFKHFALMHKEFLSLPKNDQRKLLLRNSPLYVQYILGRYITAESAVEQLYWFLGNSNMFNIITFSFLVVPTQLLFFAKTGMGVGFSVLFRT